MRFVCFNYRARFHMRIDCKRLRSRLTSSRFTAQRHVKGFARDIRTFRKSYDLSMTLQMQLLLCRMIEMLLSWNKHLSDIQYFTWWFVACIGWAEERKRRKKWENQTNDDLCHFRISVKLFRLSLYFLSSPFSNAVSVEARLCRSSACPCRHVAVASRYCITWIFDSTVDRFNKTFSTNANLIFARNQPQSVNITSMFYSPFTLNGTIVLLHAPKLFPTMVSSVNFKLLMSKYTTSVWQMSSTINIEIR